MLVAEGLVNRHIADRIYISERTVSTHMRRIFAELGVDTRAAMVYHALNSSDEIFSQQFFSVLLRATPLY